MGAIVSILFTIVTAPVIIAITFQQRHVAALLHLKSFKVMLISFILWLLLLSRAGISSGPGAASGQWAVVPSYLSSVIFIISGIMLMSGKRV